MNNKLYGIDFAPLNYILPINVNYHFLSNKKSGLRIFDLRTFLVAYHLKYKQTNRIISINKEIEIAKIIISINKMKNSKYMKDHIMYINTILKLMGKGIQNNNVFNCISYLVKFLQNMGIIDQKILTYHLYPNELEKILINSGYYKIDEEFKMDI